MLLFKTGCVQPSMSRDAPKALRRGENEVEDDEEDDEDYEDEDEDDDNDKENDKEGCLQRCMSQGALWAPRCRMVTKMMTSNNKNLLKNTESEMIKSQRIQWLFSD